MGIENAVIGLRFWSQHKDNVTITGEKYITPSTGESDKSSYEVLIKDSATMEYALTRVQSKLPQYSIFRAPRKVEDIKLDKQEISLQ